MNTTTNTARKHIPWFVAAGSALALTGTLVMVQPWQRADAVEFGADTATVAVANEAAPAEVVQAEAAPVLEAADAPDAGAADVPAEATSAVAPATAAPTTEPTRTAPAASGAVSRDQAIELAINAAGGGSAVDVSRGFERGIATWEILVRRSDGSQVEVYVSRSNGSIVKVENTTDW